MNTEFQLYLPLRCPGLGNNGFHLFEAQEKQEAYALQRQQRTIEVQALAEQRWGKGHSSYTPPQG